MSYTVDNTQWYTHPLHLSSERLRELEMRNSDDNQRTVPLIGAPEHRFSKHVTDTSEDQSKQFFPATFSVPYILQGIDVNAEKAKVSAPPPPGLNKPNTTPWKTRVDEMNLMIQENPATFSASVLTSSPYQLELGRLRMERLKLEEDHMLEVKRQDELERIRGPSPKWYELKTPRFHYEANKNNKLIHHQDNWKDLYDYRKRLIAASKDFQHKHLHS